MKYCERPELSEISQQLSRVVGDTHVTVGIELYTTKPATSDKRLIRTLDQQLSDTGFVLDPNVSAFSVTSGATSHMLSPPTSASDRLKAKTGGVSKRRAYSTPTAAVVGSPFGPLDEVGNMKQYAYLISVLNASDPDRDFSALLPSSFHRLYTEGLPLINQTLVSLGLQVPAALWSLMEEEITPAESKIYSLDLPQQFLQDDDSGILWSKMFFFFNKRRKRVLYMYMNTRPAGYRDSSSSESDAVLGELE